MRALEAEASNNNGTSIETLSNFENVRSYSDRGASSNERGQSESDVQALMQRLTDDRTNNVRNETRNE